MAPTVKSGARERGRACRADGVGRIIGGSDTRLSRGEIVMGLTANGVLQVILGTGAGAVFVGVPIMSLVVIEHVRLRVRARRFARAVSRGDLRAAERSVRGFFDLR
jgi:hypothetical protein